MEMYNKENSVNAINHITEENVKSILEMCNIGEGDFTFESFYAYNASDKMLGFLADYWKLKVYLVSKNSERKVLSFFIKALSRSNAAKTAMVKEMNLNIIETTFYTSIKNKIETAGLKPWSAKLVTQLDDAMVFEDLHAIKYKMRNKFQRFDMVHTLQALQTISRLHAGSIIYEELQRVTLKRPYSLDEEYGYLTEEGGYKDNDTWYLQCMNGALEAIRTYSKYGQNKEVLSQIEECWSSVWLLALHLNVSTEHRRVISHRDLWNNNILFHYKEVSKNRFEPDDCLLVDFQAVKSHPPAGDVMLLLHCNLDPNFREENMDTFLNFYYLELKDALEKSGIRVEDVLPKEKFLQSCTQQRQWGLLVCACLIPQFWIDDGQTTKIFSNTEQFDEIMSKDKGKFIKEMMKENMDYREKVLEIFEEIVERYCLYQNEL